MFSLSIAFGVYGVYAVVFLSAFMHELAHLVSCVILKEKIAYIRIAPYGMNLKTGMVKNEFHKMIISVAGPFASMILMVFSTDKVFFTSNLALFLINLLPALPLDGGEFLKSVLSCRIGYINSHKIMTIFSKVIGIALSFSGIFLLIMTKFNFSLLIIGVFLLYNQIEEKKNYIHLQKSIFTNEFDVSKKAFNVRVIGVDTMGYLTDVARYIGYGYRLEIHIFDGGDFVGTASQDSLLDTIVNMGANVKADKLISKGLVTCHER